MLKKDKDLVQAVAKLARPSKLQKKHTMRAASKKNLNHTCTDAPRQALAKKLKAKALYIGSNGNKSIDSIAELVGVETKTVYKWRSDEKWDQQTQSYQNTVQKLILTNLHNNIDNDKELSKTTDEKLIAVVKQLVGPNVSEIISEFLAKVHTDDLKDISKLNKAIRRKLDADEQAQLNEDVVIRRNLSLSVKEINELVTAKVNLIKATRLILGQTTENLGSNKDEGADGLTIIVNKEAADSLKLLQTSGVIDAEFALCSEKDEK